MLKNSITKNKGKQTAERARLELNDVPIPIFLFNENLSVVDSNIHAAVFFGFANKSAAAEGFAKILPPVQPDGRDSKEAQHELLTKALKEGTATSELWTYIIPGTGELIPASVIYKRIKRGATIYIIGYNHDLRDIKAAAAAIETQRLEQEKTRLLLEMKEIEQQLLMAMKESEQQQLQATLDSSPLVCAVYDTNHTILSINQKAEVLFEIPDKQLFIDDIERFMPKRQPDGADSLEKCLMMLRSAFQTGGERYEFTYQTMDGQPLPCEEILERVQIGSEEFVLVYIRDLREQNETLAKLEEAMKAEQRANKEKSRFLARMSHEIRTPMHSVLGITVAQLQNNSHTKETREAFGRIYSSSNMLLAIINSVLDFSAIESGKMEIIPAVYDTVDMIINTVQLNYVYVEGKKVKFKLTLDEKLPIRLVGDELRVKQIINNILSNAFKYTPEGSVHLSFSMESTDKNNKIIFVIKVTDTGRGMTREQVDNLSGEFLRYNPETGHTIEGTGLGLNIAYYLINMMNGTVSVESTPGKGSTFTVRLPQKAGSISVIGPEIAVALANIENIHRFHKRQPVLECEPMPYGRILVVDDVETNLYVAEGFLLPYKLQIDTANSGIMAVEKIKAGEVYDIILMDHMMPEMDGVEATNIIRGMGYEYPIIALTANAFNDMAGLYAQNGFTEYAPKPLDIFHMDTLLVRYVQNGKLRQAG